MSGSIMTEEDYDAVSTNNQKSSSSSRLKLGLMKRKTKRSSTPVGNGGLATSRSSADLTPNVSSASLASTTSMIMASTTASMAGQQTPPGVMTPPRTPSSPGFTVGGGVERDVPVCDHPHGEWKEVTRVFVDISVREIYELMYVGCRYLIKFLEDRKTTDISIGGVGRMNDGLMGRTSTFTVPVGAGATAKMTQIEVTRPCSDLDAGLQATDIEVLSAGVPYADSYTVLLHVCGKKIGPARTEFGVWAKINYKKQVWKLAKVAIESLVWRQVGVFYGGMGPAVEDAARMPPEERESWKTVLFPLEASPSSSSPSGPAQMTSGTTTTTTPSGHQNGSVSSYDGSGSAAAAPVRNGGYYPSTSSSSPSSSSTSSGFGSTLPVPYWCVMFLLLSLTWLNAFMVARLFTSGGGGGGGPQDTAAVSTAVAPFPPPTPPHHHLHDPPVSLSVDWRRFVDDQKQFRQSQVVYWKRVADMAGKLLREAEQSLDSLDGIAALGGAGTGNGNGNGIGGNEKGDDVNKDPNRGGEGQSVAADAPEVREGR